MRMFVDGVMLTAGLIDDVWSKNNNRVDTVALTTILWLFEVSLVYVIVFLRVLNAPREIDQLMTLLKQINQVNKGLNNHSPCSIKTQRSYKIRLLCYLIWIYFMPVTVYCSSLLNDMIDTYLSCSLYVVFFYMSIIVVLLKVQWSLTVMEIISAHRALNSQLKRLLESSYTNSAVNPSHGHLTIRHLAQSYESICDIVSELQKDSEIFMFLTFILMLVYLLVTPYNFIAINIAPKTSNNVLKVFDVVDQGFWLFFHLSELLIVIEPCHAMLKQTESTHHMLSRLMRQVGASNERISRELDLFLLEVQTRRPVLTPMGMFTISRQIFISIISWVATYVIIIVQMQTVLEVV